MMIMDTTEQSPLDPDSNACRSRFTHALLIHSDREVWRIFSDQVLLRREQAVIGEGEMLESVFAGASIWRSKGAENDR
jgi:hypothetical protein